MNRPLTVLFASLEALLVAGIGIGIPLVPLTVLWAVQYGLTIDWLVFWRASADVWLLGHGADVAVTLNASLADALGVEGSAASFPLTIAPLGFALITLALGARAGRRIAETPNHRLGLAATTVVFAIIAAGVALTARHPLAEPSAWQGVLLPVLVYAAGLALGALRDRRRRDDAMDALAALPGGTRLLLVSALRAGLGAVAAVLAAASLVLTAMIVLGYARIIALYEEIHAGVVGGIALTLGQLAFVPNLSIWTASWLVGPGFAIGTGSSVSPLGTQLGPLPSVPVLGALPAGDLSLGFLGIIVPVLAGFLVGIVVRPRLDAASSLPRLLGAGALIGVVAGVSLGLLAWFSAGSAGPGRLADVGPSPLLVAAFAALEIGLAAMAGLVAGGRRTPSERG